MFGGQGLALPAFGLPWENRRVEAPDLRVALAPTPVTPAEPAGAPVAEPALAPIAEPAQEASVEQPEAKGLTLAPSVSRAPATVRLAPAAVPEANPEAEVNPEPEANPEAEAGPKAEANPGTAAATGTPAASAPAHARRSRNKATPPRPVATVIAVEEIDRPIWVVPAAPAMQTPVIVPTPSPSPAVTAIPLPDVGDAPPAQKEQEVPKAVVELGKLDLSGQEGQRQAEQLEAALQQAARQAAAVREAMRQAASRRQAALQEAARQETERQEAARQAAAVQEAARQMAAQQEAARQSAAQQEAALQQAAREAAALQETARQMAAQQEAAQQVSERQAAAREEAARQELARQAAAHQEAARQEAAREEAARQEAALQEAARQQAARQEAARIEAQEAEARREARLRAIGRQLDEEAAQREAAATARQSTSPLPPPSWAPARRYRLFGRTDPNEDIIQYAEAWERKIELNMTFDTIREVVQQPHTDPMVTVAIRSDGSVESVTFVVSSGVAAIDNAIRFIVDSQKPYRAFPPRLASQWDVIEIRRTWHFDMAVRLY